MNNAKNNLVTSGEAISPLESADNLVNALDQWFKRNVELAAAASTELTAEVNAIKSQADVIMPEVNFGYLPVLCNESACDKHLRACAFTCFHTIKRLAIEVFKFRGVRFSIDDEQWESYEPARYHSSSFDCLTLWNAMKAYYTPQLAEQVIRQQSTECLVREFQLKKAGAMKQIGGRVVLEVTHYFDRLNRDSAFYELRDFGKFAFEALRAVAEFEQLPDLITAIDEIKSDRDQLKRFESGQVLGSKFGPVCITLYRSKIKWSFRADVAQAINFYVAANSETPPIQATCS